MPALEFLGRKWHIASDDLPFPSLLGAVWHFAILVLNAVDLAFVVQRLDTSCYYRNKQIGYLSAHLACFAMNGILHTWTFFESIRGAPFQVHRRRRVGPLVLAVLITYALTIGSNVYGTLLIQQISTHPQCTPLPGTLHLNHTALLHAIVISTWISLFIGVVAMLITLNLFSTCETAWLSRCRCCRTLCYCCLVDGSKPERRNTEGTSASGRSFSPMVVIANVFAVVFGGVDMTFTDYMAAFILVGVRHRHSKPALTYGNAPAPKWWAASGTGADAAQQHQHQQPSEWSAAAPGVMLMPPPVVELSVSGRSVTAIQDKPQKPEASGAQAPASSLGPAGLTSGDVVTPPSTTPTTPTPNPNPNSNLPTTTTTTTSVPSTAVSATTSVPGTAVSATATPPPAAPANGAKPSIPSSACGLQDADLEAVGALCGAPPTTRVDSRDMALPVWDGSFAEPNADIEVMKEAVYYLKFAAAVYGWKMYLWMNRLKVTTYCNLCVGRGCGCCRQSAYFIRAVGKDVGPPEGCFSAVKLLEREAITQITGVSDDDILYVCYDNKVGGLLPYYIAVDRPNQSVVVGIRGSLSLRDVVTDLVCKPAPYNVPGVPNTDESGKRTLWAHQGMLEATRAILKDIQQQGVLEGALAPPGHELKSERARAVSQRLNGSCVGYRVVVTGHSLGAGVTGLLGPLLRPQFPNLRCWAFAPPGGLMSPQAAELTREYCISVVHAKDMIPRLAVNCMENLVQQLVKAGVHCKVSKAAVMARLLLLGERPSQDDVFLQRGHTLTRELEDVLTMYDNRVEASPNCRLGAQFHDARGFVPPGHMLYIERRRTDDYQRPCCTCNVCLVDKQASVAEYTCRWIQVKDLMQVGLVISRSMFLDHLPDSTLNAMQTALTQMEQAQGPPRSKGGSSAASQTQQKTPPAALWSASTAIACQGHLGLPPRTDEVAITVLQAERGGPPPPGANREGH